MKFRESTTLGVYKSNSITVSTVRSDVSGSACCVF